MSYAMGAALQAAVYAHLQADVGLEALVGDAIYDAAPLGTPGGLYVTLGPEDVRDRSDKDGLAIPAARLVCCHAGFRAVCEARLTG